MSISAHDKPLYTALQFHQRRSDQGICLTFYQNLPINKSKFTIGPNDPSYPVVQLSNLYETEIWSLYSLKLKVKQLALMTLVTLWCNYQNFMKLKHGPYIALNQK